MTRLLLAGLIAGALVVPANALMIAPPSIAQRVATANTIVVGKVTKIEEKTVKAARFPGDKEQGEFLIAVVKVEDALVGAKGETHIRVGFIPPGAGPGRPIGGPGRGRPAFKLDEGQEVCLFLNPHFEANFLTGQAYYDLMDKKGNTNFDKEVAEIKRMAKLMADPDAGLKSKKADERFETAAMLLTRYRTRPPGSTKGKTEEVSAEQSKLILDAIAEGDWAKPAGIGQLAPFTVFYMLEPTSAGYKPGRDQNANIAAAKEWLKENSGKFRVKKFVADPAPKKD